MFSFLARRTGSALAVLFLVLTATFFVLHLAPGDPVALLDDPRIPASQKLELRELWGLDEPILRQYTSWLGHVVRGDWGTSFGHHRPVIEVVSSAIPATMALGVAALLVQLLVSIPLGFAAARCSGSRLDQTVRVVSLVVYSAPTFWLGLMALLFFSYHWPIFPPSHLQSVGADSLTPVARVFDRLHHIALPALVLGLSTCGAWIRYIRTSLLETFSQDYVDALRARGLSERRILWVHQARAALGPLLQVLGFSLPFLLSGALIVEVLFSWPGLGQVTYGAMIGRDYPLLLACTAWSASLVVFGSLIADLLHALSDPRIRESLS